MKDLLYLIGVPGSGKSTAMKGAMRLLQAPEPSVVMKPFGHRLYPGGVMLGIERAAFSGTDALGMGVQPKVLEWLRETPETQVVAEGDRLGGQSFFEGVLDAGWRLEVVYLELPPYYAEIRRARRGSEQNASWVKGRVTKVVKVAQRWATANIDGRLAPGEVAELLAAMPTMRALAGKAMNRRELMDRQRLSSALAGDVCPTIGLSSALCYQLAKGSLRLSLETSVRLYGSLRSSA